GRSQRRPPHWGDGTRSEYDHAHELLHQADEHGSLVAMGEERTEGPATSEMPRWYEPTGSVPAWRPHSAYGDAGGSGTGGSDDSGGGGYGGGGYGGGGPGGGWDHGSPYGSWGPPPRQRPPGPRLWLAVLAALAAAIVLIGGVGSAIAFAIRGLSSI